MSVTMKKPEATLGDTSVEASLLSNHIQKESTGNARRDSTDLTSRKSIEVKKQKSVSINQHPILVSAPSSKPGSVTSKNQPLTMSRLLHQKILLEQKQMSQLPTKAGTRQESSLQSHVSTNSYSSILKANHAKVASIHAAENSSFVY